MIEKEGIISISVIDRDPHRAAAMANALVEYLDSLNVELSIQKARNNRIFIEKRFNQNKSDLTKAEEELKTFEEKYGAIALPAQTEVAIRSAAELQARIITTEVDLGIKEKFLMPTHKDLIQTQNTLTELKKKLEAMRRKNHDPGQNPNNHSNDDPFFIPFTEVPRIGLEYARLYRELEVQKTLYQLLIQPQNQTKTNDHHPTGRNISDADLCRRYFYF
jgi:capsule polysaccharide export protein KpsE/RkpR